MSQPATSSRLTNSSVNIKGSSAAISTNYGLARIGVTGNSFDISASGSGTVTLGITGSGNVQLGNATSGTVSFGGSTTFANINGANATSTINVGSNLTSGGIVALGSTTSATNVYGTLYTPIISGPTAGSTLTIGNNITSGSVSIGNAGAANTVTIGNNGGSATGTVNVGVSSTTVNIGNNLLGTSINLGNGTTGTSNINSKTVNISNGVGGTTNIYSPAVFLGNGDTGTTTIYSPNTNVGTTLSGTTNLYSPTMNIGVTGGTIALKATTSVATIDAAVAATGMNIGNNITTGNLNFLTNAAFSGNVYIASSNTARSGTFDIATAGTGTVTIGSANSQLALKGSTVTFTGTTTLATTNVATLNAIAPATGMEIGSNITGGNFGLLGNSSFIGNVYIGANNTGRSGTADIFTAGTGTVSIGSLNATLALRGNTTTLSSALTLGSSPGSVGTNTATPNLGQFMTVSIASGNNTPSASLQIVTPGVYIVTYYLIGTGAGVLGNYFMSGGVSLTGPIIQSSTTQSYSMGTVIASVAAGTYNLSSSFNVGTLSVTSGTLTFCRIG